MENQQKIIFYDGDCGFCNRTVQWILKNETTETVYFSAIQSMFSTRFFDENDLNQPDLTTFYFWKNGRIYSKSSAALMLVHELRWYWKWLFFGYLIPRKLRDKMYDFVARRRNSLFKKSCYVPDKDRASRFYF